MKTTLIIIIIIVIICLPKLRYLWFNYKLNKIKGPYLDALYEKFKHRFSTSSRGTVPNHIDNVYCIYAKDREQYVKNQLHSFDMKVTYFDAIFPTDLTKQDYDTLSCTNKRFCGKIYNKQTKFPVQMSYIMCMMDAMKKGYKTIIIFEDDIVINVDRDTLAASIEEFAASPYEMFYMGYCWMSCNQDFNTTQHDYLVKVPNNKLKCTHAIALKTDNFPDLINYMFPMTVPNDVSFSNYFKQFGTQICVPKFSYFDQDRENLGTLNDNLAIKHETCDLT